MTRDPSAERAAAAIYAGFWRRLLALLLDGLVLLCIGWTVFGVALHSRSLAMLVAVASGAIGFLYTVALHAIRGQTLGKMALGITVLRSDGGRIGWSEALRRSSVDIAFWAILSVGTLASLAALPEARFDGSSWIRLQADLFAQRSSVLRYMDWLWTAWLGSEVVTMLFNARKRALHDLIAGTVVARTGAQVRVAATQSWRGVSITPRKVVRAGFALVGLAVAGFAAILVWAFFLTSTKTGAAVAERMGLLGEHEVELTAGVRLRRPDGWSLTTDDVGGYVLHELGPSEADIRVWSASLGDLAGRAEAAASDLSAIGRRIADEQRARTKKALHDTWAAGVDVYKGYELQGSRTVTIRGRKWGEDVMVRRDGPKNYVLVNRYTLHGDGAVVVVDGYEVAADDSSDPSARESVIAPVMKALEFSFAGKPTASG